MLTLLYGTHGARAEIYNRIADDAAAGRRAYLIVPDQKALLAESALMRALPKSAALLVDAVGFSRLANLVCRRYGSLTYRYASEGAKVVTMYRAVKNLRPQLKVFGGELQNGQLQALCTLMGEFRACKVRADELSDAADRLRDAPLADKIRDLALLYTEYETLLHLHFAEQADDLDTLAELLRDHDFFGDARVYIDAFISFTGQEMAVLSHMLARGVPVTIALPYRFGGAHMAEIADTRKKLIALAAKLAVRFSEETVGDASPAPLAFAKENLWDFSVTERFAEPTDDTLAVVECTDKNEEALLCLGEIFRATEAGLSYSDIAIIARNAESYCGTLDRALMRCDIPFFFSKKTSAELLPLTKFILSALALYIYNFKESDVAAYLQTGLCDLSDDECDLFSEYVDRWNVCGRARYLDGEDFTMSGKGYSAEITDKETLAEINAIKRKLAAPLSRLCDTLDGAKTVRDFTEAVFTYLTELSVRERSVDPAFVKYFGTDKTAEAIRLWNLTMEALDTLVDAAGDAVTTAAEFAALVRLLFSAIDIARIPSSMDQIMIGNADTIRIDERKIVLILGANEGVFPAPVSESPTLGEQERNELSEVGISLSQDLRMRSAREFYHFARAIDFATERAVVSYCTADADGRACTPSFAITRLRRLFSSLCDGPFAALAPMDKLFYKATAVDAIGRYDPDTEAVLREVLTKSGDYTPPLQDASMLGNADAALDPTVARSLYGDAMQLSQSKIDCYSDCRLRHFMQYVLTLEDTAPFEFNPANTGTFVHSVLENFILLTKEAGRSLKDYTDEELEEIASSLCAVETEKILRSGRSNARMLCFFARMHRHLSLILKNLVAEFKNSDFEPFLTEYRIGFGGHSPLVVTLGDGGSVTLNGIADRVDICKKDGKVYLRVADYKTGKKPFTESDLLKGKNLQLLIYLFSLCEVADKEFFDLLGVDSTEEILPAGATYFVVKAPNISLDTPPEDDLSDTAAAALERKGYLFSADKLADAIDRTENKCFTKKLIEKNADETADLLATVKTSIANVANGMRGGRIDTSDTQTGANAPCRYCAYLHICRKENKKGDEDDG